MTGSRAPISLSVFVLETTNTRLRLLPRDLDQDSMLAWLLPPE
jgi:hypothetical protein